MALHWLLALMFTVALVGGAVVLVGIPNSDPMKEEALRQHFAGGVLLAALMLVRLIVRTRTAHPPRASTGNVLLDRSAWLSHRLLYLLVFLQAASGLVMAAQTGLLSLRFGGHAALPSDFWAYPIRTAHFLFSRLLVAVIALHVLGALYHTLMLRDGLLRRMWFGPRRAASGLAAAPGGARPSSEGTTA